MAGMPSPPDPDVPAHRTSMLGTGMPGIGLLARLWRSLSGTPPAEAAPPPLFRGRPVPPPEPRGPGLPPLDDILTAAPPVPDPVRAPRLVLLPGGPLGEPLAPVASAPVASAPIVSAPIASPPAVPAAMVPAPVVPARPARGLTPIERQAAERIRALIGAGLIGEATALLEAHFRDQPDLRDRAGLPIYLVDSFRCAAMQDRREDMRRWADAVRPLLAENDPLLEAIAARAAVRRREPAAARAAWHAALARAPDLAEARDWLARNPVAPDGGVAAAELISGPRPLLQPAPPRPHPAAPLPDAPLPYALPSGAPGQWLRHVAIRVAETAATADAGWDTARDIPGAAEDDVAALLLAPDDIARPHMFGETALALFALTRASDPPLRLARLYAGRQPWATRPSQAPQAEMLAVLFPGLRVVAAFDGAVRETAVLALDGAARDQATGTLIGGMMPLLPRAAAEARARVFAAYGLPGSERPLRVQGRKPQALYLQATPARALADTARDRLLPLLERGGFEVTTVDMASLPFREQVRLAAGADLLFGVHGPWMASALWAHPQARLLELFPPGVRRYDTQVLAEAAGIAYLGLEGLAADGFVTQGGHRIGPPAGNPGGIVSDLPWPLLQRALGLG